MPATMMRCGCRAQGNTQDGKPICVTHFDTPEGREEAPAPDLSGRESVCCYCRKTKPSSVELPFFTHHPERQMDSHYDGCRGWD